MYKFLATALATAAIVANVNIAHATNVKVTVFETIAGVSQQVASWTQNQDPTPMTSVSGYYTTVPVFNASGLGGDTTVTWYSSTNDQLGGFTNFDEDFNILAQTSYTSDESAPIFLPGTYHGVDVKPNLSYLIASYTITVLPPSLFRSAFVPFNSPAATPAPVPEPTSWAMMFAGLGMIGVVVRRRRKVARADA